MGSGFLKKKKQAKALQQQFTEYQESLKTKEVSGTSGGGLVHLCMNGEGDLLSIKISPECVDSDDVEALQDLILAAFRDAKTKLDAELPASGLPGMNQIPGFSSGFFA